VGQMQQRRRTDASAHSWGDDALLAAIQARNDAALAALYDRYGRPAFGLASGILGERGVAEEVVREAFLTIWRRAGEFQPGRGSVRSWLMSIIHRLAIDRRRGRQGRAWTDGALDNVATSLESDADGAYTVVTQAITAERVQTVLGDLPEEQRQAIVMAYFDGMTHQEIARETGTPLGTVKSRMRLGLRRMRALLGDETAGE
jgi:RNA polymerase sigma factor (sigma-70 family)